MTARCAQCPENFLESLTMPIAQAIFPEISNESFLPMDAMKMRAKFEVLSFTYS